MNKDQAALGTGSVFTGETNEDHAVEAHTELPPVNLDHYFVLPLGIVPFGDQVVGSSALYMAPILCLSRLPRRKGFIRS